MDAIEQGGFGSLGHKATPNSQIYRPFQRGPSTKPAGGIGLHNFTTRGN